MTTRPARTIRTPDQRLRVFVSSTIRELAEERKAARAAIEGLHLAPVLFELGARPHPPRELYRAYLDQSHVFVGCYGSSYGWVAPGETVSGLEDEYNLSSTLPRLIYIKEPTDAREPRLTALLDRILGDNAASFKVFETAAELAELLRSDLATLLAERFELSHTEASATDAGGDQGEIGAYQKPTAGHLPIPLTELIGRAREALTLRGLLERRAVRLVTLLGPGGIGKSRLAVEVADRIAGDFPDGVFFVDLSSTHSVSGVVSAIAEAIGVRDTGNVPLLDKVSTALREGRALLVLDNFEQVLEGAPVLVRLLSSSAGLKILATSRSVLNVTGEHTFELGPLGLPRVGRISVRDAAGSPAVELFVERARAVKPDFELTADNVAAVARICVGLDGVPLALELAAARIRMLPPAVMVGRLDRRLPMLAGGARDLPERQQTLRATIDWSVRLLGSEEKDLLARLGVFAGAFSLDAAEVICGNGVDTGVVDELSALVNNSLVRELDGGGASTRFTLLATVREYSLELLGAMGEAEEVRRAHAEYFLSVAERAEAHLHGSRQREWMARLAEDRENLRASVEFWLTAGDWDTAARFAWELYVYWWVGGLLGEVRGWMELVLSSGAPLSELARAQALYFTRAITFWQDPAGVVVPGLTESAELFGRAGRPAGEALALVSLALAVLVTESPDPPRAAAALERSLRLFREADDTWGEAMALVMIGRVELVSQRPTDALGRFEQSLAITRFQRDELGATIALHHRGWATLALGRIDSAAADFSESLGLSARLGHDEGVAYGLEGLLAIAAVRGDVERAGGLLGAAESQRDRSGLYNPPGWSFYQPALDQLLSAGGSAQFESARSRGRRLSLDDAIYFADPALTRAGHGPVGHPPRRHGPSSDVRF